MVWKRENLAIRCRWQIWYWDRNPELLFCKAPPPLTKKGSSTNDATKWSEWWNVYRVHNVLASAHEYQWALHPPENIDGFVSHTGKIWAIARVGESSDVGHVTEVAKVIVSRDSATKILWVGWCGRSWHSKECQCYSKQWERAVHQYYYGILGEGRCQQQTKGKIVCFGC